MENNSILTKDNMTEVVPKWQHPILPGRAVQGSLLFTTTDFVNPPQSAADFTWIAMEEICGIHDTKCYYDEKDNVYHFYKSIGHLNNDETWAEDWYEFATVQGISKEAQEMLEQMEYIVYTFDKTTTEHGTLLEVHGTRKDGTVDLILEIDIPDKDYIDRQDNYYKPINGNATSVNQTDDGREVNVQWDEMDGLTVNDDNELKIKVDNDTVKFNDNGELISDSAIADEITIHKDEDSHVISAIIDTNRGLLPTDRGIATKIDNSMTYTDAGELHSKGSLQDGIATDISEFDTYNKVNVRYDENTGLTRNVDTNRLQVKVDNETIDFNTSGELHATGDIRDGDATKINHDIDSDGNKYATVNVRTDTMKGIDISNENKLITKINGAEGLEYDENGYIKAKVDGATVRIDDYGRLEAVPVEVREGKAIDIRKIEDQGDPYYVVDAIGDGTTIGYNDHTDLKVIPNTQKGIKTSNKGVEAKVHSWDATCIAADGDIGVKLADDWSGMQIRQMPNDVDSGLQINCGKGLWPEQSNDTIRVLLDTDSGMIFNSSNYDALRVMTNRGINISGNRVGLNANFTNSDQPLGTNKSNIILHSDGKIEVNAAGNPDNKSIELNDDEELQVKLSKHPMLDANHSGLKVVEEPSSVETIGLKVNCGEGTAINGDNQLVAKIDPEAGLKFDSYGSMQANLDRGLDFTSSGKITVAANYTESSEPLGSKVSNVIRHSDGKLEFVGNASVDDKAIGKDENNDICLKLDKSEDPDTPEENGLIILPKQYGTTGGLKVNVGPGIKIDEWNCVAADIIDGDGIRVDDGSIVNVNTNYVNTQDSLGDKFGGLELHRLDNKLSIAANFTKFDTPLGDNRSNLALYSDGKIGVNAQLPGTMRLWKEVDITNGLNEISPASYTLPSTARWANIDVNGMTAVKDAPTYFDLDPLLTYKYFICITGIFGSGTTGEAVWSTIRFQFHEDTNWESLTTCADVGRYWGSSSYFHGAALTDYPNISGCRLSFVRLNTGSAWTYTVKAFSGVHLSVFAFPL